MKTYDKDAWLKHIDSGIAQGPFRPDWDSLSEMRVPSWFGTKKLGIFIHWGPYSVPAFANEWYSRNMYIPGTEEYQHHIDTYGPHASFGYKDFIPMLTAKKFDPKEWIRLFKEAGAGYIFPVAEHHDGFQMYDSELSDWNAVNMGPHRDILKELKEAAEAEGMHFCTSSHRAEHWWFMGHGMEYDSDIRRAKTAAEEAEMKESDAPRRFSDDKAFHRRDIPKSDPALRGPDPWDFYEPAMPERDNFDMESEPAPDETYLADWLIRTVELVDRYQPELLYFDWWIQHKAFEPYLKRFLAYYYNLGVRNGRPTAVCYKHEALAFGSGIVEVERGGFPDMKAFPWQTDTASAWNSWCYTDTLEYKTPGVIIRTLIDVVSRNGNLLLNIGPKADGTIPEGDKKILSALGRWIRVNGEAIYGAKPWRICKEGPTEDKAGSFSEEEKKYTEEDIRFTVNHGNLYIFLMKTPSDGIVKICSLNRKAQPDRPAYLGHISRVELLLEKREIKKIESEKKDPTDHFEEREKAIDRIPCRFWMTDDGMQIRLPEYFETDDPELPKVLCMIQD